MCTVQYMHDEKFHVMFFSIVVYRRYILSFQMLLFDIHYLTFLCHSKFCSEKDACLFYHIVGPDLSKNKSYLKRIYLTT